MASNLWVTNGSQRWYVQEDGTRATGFVKYKKYTYYFNSFGSMVKGLRVINGKIYFFRENGTMTTGWKCLSKRSIISHRTVLQLPDGWKSMEAGITFSLME
ncbi:MAG: hypothetical protein ACLR2E_04595 [Lachnospiraceae bacterium]